MITTNYFERKDDKCLVPFQDIEDRNLYNMNSDFILVINVIEDDKLYIDHEYSNKAPEKGIIFCEQLPNGTASFIEVGLWKLKIKLIEG